RGPTDVPADEGAWNLRTASRLSRARTGQIAIRVATGRDAGLHSVASLGRDDHVGTPTAAAACRSTDRPGGPVAAHCVCHPWAHAAGRHGAAVAAHRRA